MAATRAPFSASSAPNGSAPSGGSRTRTTDQVRFVPLGTREPEPIPIADVPPLVFSEAMRDVDLFVGVASIGADPAWVDRGEARHHDYWNQASFGELTE